MLGVALVAVLIFLIIFFTFLHLIEIMSCSETSAVCLKWSWTITVFPMSECISVIFIVNITTGSVVYLKCCREFSWSFAPKTF